MDPHVDLERFMGLFTFLRSATAGGVVVRVNEIVSRSATYFARGGGESHPVVQTPKVWEFECVYTLR